MGGLKSRHEVYKMEFIIFVLLLFSTCRVQTSTSSVTNWTSQNTYDKVKRLSEMLLSPERYSSVIRPIEDQTKPVLVRISFSLIAIAGLDDVTQELLTNGFLILTWTDERLKWNTEKEYRNIYVLSPDQRDVWKPQMLLINAFGDRDDLKEQESHLSVSQLGRVLWTPGGLFSTYCRLNMDNYPFDQQSCSIQFCPFQYTRYLVQFRLGGLNLAFFINNQGWDLIGHSLTISNNSIIADQQPFSCPTLTLHLKRRPKAILLTVILPVAVLSFLNNLVFLIPIESGEKISYAITILLSMAVFLGIINQMTPKASDVVPAITLYLSILTLFSALSITITIATFYIHNRTQMQAECVSHLEFCTECKKKKRLSILPDNSTEDRAFPKEKTKHDKHMHTSLTDRIQKVSFVVFNFCWVVATVWFFTDTYFF